MRVLFVNSFGGKGGAERSLIELAGAIDSNGLDVAVAIPEGAAANAIRDGGIKVYPIPQFRLHRIGANPFRIVSDAALFFKARNAVNRAIRNFEPDIIHANSLQAALATAPVFSKRIKNGAPFFMHVRDMRFPARAMCFAARRVSCIVAISHAVESHLLNILPNDLHRKVRRIQNAIDSDAILKKRVDRLEARKRLGLPPDAIVIGMMSHFAPWKHHDNFVAMAKLMLQPNTITGSSQKCISSRETSYLLPFTPYLDRIHFAVAGIDIGNDNPGISRMLFSAANDPSLAGRLHLLGDVDGACFLSAIDCLVHPAIGEPFGRVIAEAKAFGLPIVAMDSGGPAEQLHDYPNAELIPESDSIPQSLAEASIRLLSRLETQVSLR